MMRQRLYTSIGILFTVFLGPQVGAEMLTRLVIDPTPENPRNSEGDIIELEDGRLCLIYSRFTGGSSDHARADLAMRTSTDGGKTWSKDVIAVPFEGGKNVMSVSLLRLQNGEIALFYARKRSLADCRPVLRISRDECQTWGKPRVCITDEIGYYVVNNDRVVQLKSGRLVIPAAQHTSGNESWFPGRALCYLSDDDGRTWRRSRTVLTLPQKDCPAGLQEPGIVELRNGELLMFCRTNQGSQFLSSSGDGGETWSQVRPSNLASPLSPATIERIPWSGNLLCVWNDHSGHHDYPPGKRTPLCMAISKDEGQTWSRSRVIESDPDGWYCYTSLSFVRDGVILAYCAGDGVVGRLNRLKVVTLSRGWLEENLSLAGDAEPEALLESCLDYGRSFINTRAVWNSPRFCVESRLRIVDPKTGESAEYYQCASCKCEDTFGKGNLFCEDNYDFLPVFSEKECVIFRRRSRVVGQYREMREVESAWDGTVPKLRKFKGRVLTTPEEIFAAMDSGRPLVGQTELRDEKTGRIAVIEYPIKTINWHRDRKIWQVDTGPVLLPDLSLGAGGWSESLRLAYVAFRSSLIPSASAQFPEWADLIVEQPTAVGDEEETAVSVYHYSGTQRKKARNRLIAYEGS
jgi:hypothetical protein